MKRDGLAKVSPPDEESAEIVARATSEVLASLLSDAEVIVQVRDAVRARLRQRTGPLLPSSHAPPPQHQKQQPPDRDFGLSEGSVQRGEAEASEAAAPVTHEAVRLTHEAGAGSSEDGYTFDGEDTFDAGADATFGSAGFATVAQPAGDAAEAAAGSALDML
jgi:hypothetical protein